MRTLALLIAAALPGACAAVGSDPPPTTGRATLAVAAMLALGDAVAVDVRDSIAAVGLGGGGLALLDVSRPEAPAVIARLDDLDARAVAFGRDGLVVAGAGGGFGAASLHAVDVLDPTQPAVTQSQSAAIDAGAALSLENGVIACVRGQDGPLLTDEDRLDLARVRAVLDDDRDDAVLLRRGLLFVHASSRPWIGGATHRLVVADPRRDEPRDVVALPGTPADHGALALVGDDLLCARADAVDVLAAATTPSIRLGGALPLARVTRIADDGGRAALLAEDGMRLVLVERGGGGLEIAATLELSARGRAVALQDDTVLVASGDVGLLVVRVGRAAP